VIRGPRKSDQSFLAATWVRNLSGAANRRLGPHGGEIGRQVDAVFDRDDTRALIRYAAGDMDHILGYVVYVEGAGVPVVHYLYTRKDNRARGVASELLRAAGVKRDSAVVCTSLGPDSMRMRSRYKGAVHMPLNDFLKPETR
jgi:GNAT superfamily N-acetyltransferase